MTVKQDISRVRVSGGTFLIIYAMQGHADSGNVYECKRRDGERAIWRSSKGQRVDNRGVEN